MLIMIQSAATGIMCLLDIYGKQGLFWFFELEFFEIPGAWTVHGIA